MSKIELKIQIWPSKILKQRCKKVDVVDDEIRQILDDMLQLMRESKGIGLAANQAGLDKRLVVIEIEDKIIKLVNPRILSKEGHMKFREGCLSFPGLDLDVIRASKILVEALDAQGKPLRFEAGETIFNQGDPADCVYFITEGEVEASYQHPEHGKITLRRIGTHEYFGVSAVFNQGTRQATAVALSPVEMVRMKPDDFHLLHTHLPRLREDLEKQLERRESELAAK